MNKKIIIALILSISFSFLAGTANAAQNNILPSNPFYFFKDLGREIQDFLTFDVNKKIELRIKVAEEKLSEIEQIAEENPNNPNYENYLNKYKDAVLKIQEKASTLTQEKKEQVLENITSKMIEQEQRLENLKTNIRSDKINKIEEIKNNVVDEYTATSLKIADTKTVQNKIEEKLQNLGEEKTIQVLNRINSDNFSNVLKETDLLKLVNNENDILKIATEKASSLGLTPEEILDKVSTFSAEDKQKLEKYALEILAGNVKLEDAINNIELSEDAILKIQSLKEESEISNYCISQGNKIIIEDNIRYCVSNEGNKCEELEYFKKNCILD